MSQTIKEERATQTPASLEVNAINPEVKSRPARRYSLLEKTAMITSTLRFMAAGIALLGFAFNHATPNSDVPIVTLVSLVITLLVVTRLRWTPVVTIPLAAYVLYDTFTQPFLLFDLANPKGPNGGQGFALFIAGVLALASTIIVLACCIGIALKNYRPSSARVPRWYGPLMYLVTGMVVGALFIGTLAQPRAASSAAVTNGVPTVHMGAGGFDQPSITISKGSRLLLVDDDAVEHVILNGSWQNGNLANT
ncbi:MAG TPA: hypothetical protein VFN23_04875, partial [Ktedonobacteraceae bacterium]|nr:hypothetical protein [Ktedonobacteraceae bacterium]